MGCTWHFLPREEHCCGSGHNINRGFSQCFGKYGWLRKKKDRMYETTSYLSASATEWLCSRNWLPLNRHLVCEATAQFSLAMLSWMPDWSSVNIMFLYQFVMTLIAILKHPLNKMVDWIEGNQIWPLSLVKNHEKVPNFQQFLFERFNQDCPGQADQRGNSGQHVVASKTLTVIWELFL